MKRIIAMFALVLLLTAALGTPALAAGESASLTSTSVQAGSQATLTLSLSGFATTTPAIGVTVTTPDGLTWNTSASKWWNESGVHDIGSYNKNQAVWTGEADINTGVMTLVFDVPAGTAKDEYTVSCALVVKAGGDTLYSGTVSGKITVVKPATDLTLSATSLNLKIGETATLTAAVEPGDSSDTVSWASSNPAVATVTAGVVEAKGAGTATITATAGAHTRSCTVTVTCPHTAATETAAKAPTCTETGNNQYFTCAEVTCGKVLKPDKKTTTTVEAETLAMIAHTGGTATCTEKAVCTMCSNPYGDTLPHQAGTAWEKDAANHWHVCKNCPAKMDEAAHTFAWVTDKAATENATGLKHEECSVCGAKRSENTVIPKLDHVHGNIKHYPAVPATCQAAGTLEYWTCGSEKCAGKYYSDAACQLELKSIQGEAKKDHTLEWVIDQEPTEEKAGKRHQACKDCGYTDGKYEDIPKLEHKPELVSGKKPTCTRNGLEEHFYCENCGRYYSSIDGKAGNQILEGDTVIKATGHSFATEWKGGEEGHWHICETCGGKSKAEAHETELTGAKEATEEEAGYTGDSLCTICGWEVEKGEEIPVLSQETVPMTEPTEALATPETAPEQETAEPTAPVEKEEGKSPMQGLLWLCVVLALLGAAGTVFWFLLAKKRK